jgi:hypothetical protein
MDESLEFFRFEEFLFVHNQQVGFFELLLVDVSYLRGE